ncbi:MAG: hypothetical protein AABZ74_03095 [Cyanobacteriota bacterium]|mgnify:CR=1 FL=1
MNIENLDFDNKIKTNIFIKYLISEYKTINIDFIICLINRILDNKYSTYYIHLSKILHIFYNKLDFITKEKIINTLKENNIVSQRNDADLILDLLKNKNFKQAEELIDIFQYNKLKNNSIRVLSSYIYENFNFLSIKVKNYIITLSQNYFESKQIIWTFFEYFEQIDDIIKNKIINNFIFSKNKQTIYVLILSITQSNHIKQDIKNKLILKILKLNNNVLIFENLLIQKYEIFDKKIINYILLYVFYNGNKPLKLLYCIIKKIEEIHEITLNKIHKYLEKTPKSLSYYELNRKYSLKIINEFYIEKNILNKELINILFNNYFSKPKILNLMIYDKNKHFQFENIENIIISIIEENILLTKILKNDYNFILKKRLIDLFIVYEKINRIFDKNKNKYEYLKDFKEDLDKLSNLAYRNKDVEIFKSEIKNYINSDNLLESDILIYKDKTDKIFFDLVIEINESYNNNNNIIKKNLKEEKLNVLREFTNNKKFKSKIIRYFLNLKNIYIISNKLLINYDDFSIEFREKTLILLLDFFIVSNSREVEILLYRISIYNKDKIPKEILIKIYKKIIYSDYTEKPILNQNNYNLDDCVQFTNDFNY